MRAAIRLERLQRHAAAAARVAREQAAVRVEVYKEKQKQQKHAPQSPRKSKKQKEEPEMKPATVPFPFRKMNSIDRWSEHWRTFGTFGPNLTKSGQHRERHASAALTTRRGQRPGSAPLRTTLYLGNGLKYDRAEAARVARAERNGECAADTAYPLAPGVFEQWVTYQTLSADGKSRVIFQGESPAVVHVQPGGVCGGLSSLPTRPPVRWEGKTARQRSAESEGTRQVV